MSNNQWVQERHASGLDTLERMLQESDGASQHGRRLSLGLFEEDHVWAVAVAEVSVRRGLQVRSLAVNPSQLHLTDSTTYQRMLHAGLCMSGRGLVCEAASQPMPHHTPPAVPWPGLLPPQPAHTLGIPWPGRRPPSARHGPPRPTTARPTTARPALGRGALGAPALTPPGSPPAGTA